MAEEGIRPQMYSAPEDAAQNRGKFLPGDIYARARRNLVSIGTWILAVPILYFGIQGAMYLRNHPTFLNSDDHTSSLIVPPVSSPTPRVYAPPSGGNIDQSQLPSVDTPGYNQENYDQVSIITFNGADGNHYVAEIFNRESTTVAHDNAAFVEIYRFDTSTGKYTPFTHVEKLSNENQYITGIAVSDNPNDQYIAIAWDDYKSYTVPDGYLTIFHLRNVSNLGEWSKLQADVYSVYRFGGEVKGDLTFTPGNVKQGIDHGIFQVSYVPWSDKNGTAYPAQQQIPDTPLPVPVQHHNPQN